MSDKVEVRNVHQPGKVGRVDAAKYAAMKDAMVSALTGSAPLTAAQVKAAVLPHLPNDLFPGGETAGWWIKCVQLDLEARGEMQRHDTRPLTFSLA